MSSAPLGAAVITQPRHIGWGGIARLGLVQACLGAIVVLTTSTLNRVMVVELALPASLPGALVAMHYLIQVVRPRMGHGSDVRGRRTPWIVGGMFLLAFGGIGAALATTWMAIAPVAGLVLAVIAFLLIGTGVSASGTSLLVLLAKSVAPERRAAAATLVWMMMIAGFAITAGVAGKLLDQYSPSRLLAVTAVVSTVATLITLVALYGIEGVPHRKPANGEVAGGRPSVAFRAALAEVWSEPVARRFTVFVFVSMLAYSAQDLILEPFAGHVFAMTPGESTRLSGIQHGGVLVGMLIAAAVGSRYGERRLGSPAAWSSGGCVASSIALLGLVLAGHIGMPWPMKANVFVLGVANGAFSIAAIASMMRLASQGRESREGLRMGLWGAAQAVAFGLGGLLGTAASDLARRLVGEVGTAYAAVFAFEAALFLVAAVLSGRVHQARPKNSPKSSLLAEAEPISQAT